jgi:hypothetical protein
LEYRKKSESGDQSTGMAFRDSSTPEEATLAGPPFIS